MIINLTPLRHDEQMMLSRSGDVLTINGETLDFSPLPDGATLPSTAIDCDWIAGDVTREGGALTVPIFLPVGPNAPEETRFPELITLTSDGPVELPPYSTPEVAK